MPEKQLRPYQETNIDQLLEWKKGFIADEPGLGKSASALMVVEKAQAYPCLVVTPSIGKPSWAKELAWWLDQKRSISILEGEKWIESKNPISVRLPDQTRVNIPVNVMESDIIIVNYDILPNWLDFLLELSFKSFILDESHYIKNSKAKRSKAAKKLALKGLDGEPIPYVLLLSGTPILNNPYELLHQLAVIDGLKYVGGYKWFIERYCNPKPLLVPVRNKVTGAREMRKILDTRGANKATLSELNNRLKKYCMVRHTKKEVLEWLDPINRIVIPVELTNKKEYIKAENDFIQWIGSFVIEQRKFKASLAGLSKEQVERVVRERQLDAKFKAARNEALVKLGYLRQLADIGKIKANIELTNNLLEQSEKLIIFPYFQEVQYALLDAFPKALHILSSDSDRQRLKAEEMFQGDENEGLIIVSLMCGGINLTLTKATSVIFPGLYWTPTVLDQAEGRAYGRANDPHSINSYYTIADETIDEKIQEIIEHKRKIVDLTIDGKINEVNLSVVGDLKKYYWDLAKERFK
jgi:SWI/SNF-related matrix-associated actin-dependent regulator of chromatin subfamily A-like protein 1